MVIRVSFESMHLNACAGELISVVASLLNRVLYMTTRPLLSSVKIKFSRLPTQIAVDP